MELRGECAEKSRLVLKFSRAAEDYANSVSLLVNNMGVVAREEYDRLHLSSEKARVEAEQARLELESHAREHGC